MAEVSNLAIEELKKLVTEKGSKKAAAEGLDIHPSYFGEILNGTRDLSDNVLAKIGFTRISVDVPSGSVPLVTHAIESALQEVEGLQRVKSKVMKKK